MKKWLSIVMTVVLMLTCMTAFAGCGAKEDNTLVIARPILTDCHWIGYAGI